ncbi:DUF1990 domain-containing protein [Deinococcus marmoris]|uniref:DUF1990 domain-containing protein n=1 Tax=Deinococcus marmoris TaxID=249408 RepID=A0A1U7NS01_9DEIO|nr:DUF1990 domain-containing protein [Deinococcus marmoris]OLV15698.1 hypothetical protein BOO71_0014134 [Deinococcus marmoris]
MFFLHRPTPKQAQAFLERQRQAAYSYAEVGQTRTALHPTGYAIDQHSTRLGTGDECFTLARAALKTWKVFETPWIRLTNPAAPFTEGETLVVQIAHLGFFSLVADRVVYVIDEPDCCGFAYGTLTGHAEQGEERFLVSRSASGEVTFGLSAFSRPRHPLACLGQPVVRQLQRAAAQAYTAAMMSAVKEAK